MVLVASLLASALFSTVAAAYDARGWAFTNWRRSGTTYYARAKGYAGEDPVVRRDFSFDSRTVYRWAYNYNQTVKPVSRATFWARIPAAQKRGQYTWLTFVRKTDSRGHQYWYVKQACGGVIGD